MSYVFIIMIVVAVGAVVTALVRGLMAFANMQPDDVDSDGITASHKKQNDMMWARVKYQGIAVILVVLMLVIAGSNS